MELMQCFEPGCNREVEYTCRCTSPSTLSCELHFGKHMKLPNRTHVFDSIFVEPYQGTKEAILKFLAKEESKNGKLKRKFLESFSQHLFKSRNEAEEFLKNFNSISVEISNYFIKISQTQKLSRSEQDPILGLLNLHPDEAVEKLKKMIPANQEWRNDVKLFCGFNEKIESMIDCFIEGKFEAYLNKRLSNIENTLEEHNKIINSGSEENKKIIDRTDDELRNIKDSISKLINKNKKRKRNLEDWKKEIKLNMENEKDLTIKITQDLIKNNEAEKSQKIQELRDKTVEILTRLNNPELEQDFRRTSQIYEIGACIYDPLIQQAYQDYKNAYCKNAFLYAIKEENNRTNLTVYDTENNSKETRVLETPETLNNGTCIAQLPNSNIFCFGCSPSSGISLIIDKNYSIQQLSSGTSCKWSSAIYFNNSVYCFGGADKNWSSLTLSERFDLHEKQWIKLCPLPQADRSCNSVIFNGNILISGHVNKNLLRYSIDTSIFTIIPYDFKGENDKILINAERLYLIECLNGSIYESEVSNDTVWRRIADSTISESYYQVYTAYNKGAINIAYYGNRGLRHYKFNLMEKILNELA